MNDKRQRDRLNTITGIVVDSAIAVHTAVGPGLLEGAYEACMVYELVSRGVSVRSQVRFPVRYREVELELAYRIDLLVEDAVIVELKAVNALHPVHEAQLLSYLRLTNLRVGLLINFHTTRLRDGIRRLVNDW